ncbi:MAG TPA: TetR/AcrR family transcriptional regulator [Kofleriaceae bacterium]|nr:TetR/AcrR family transcriptional regulator [Kofleriaceae bacterium]
MPPRRAPPRRPARARARPRRRIRLENDPRRAQLLALARRAFSDKSYDEVSIDDLARAAKISKGLLYHYVPTKRDLYVAGLTEIANELVAAITAVPEEGAPIDRVREGLDAYLGHVMEHSRAFVSLMRGGIGSDPEVALVVEGVRGRLFQRLLSGSPLAGMVAGDPKVELAVRGWIGFVEAASIDWCASPRVTRVELRELLAQVLLEVLRVVAPGGLRR